MFSKLCNVRLAQPIRRSEALALTCENLIRRAEALRYTWEKLRRAETLRYTWENL